jgi:hypothetical protein
MSDAVEAVDRLQQNGDAVAICSNLVMSYGSVVSSQFPSHVLMRMPYASDEHTFKILQSWQAFD